MCGLLAGAHAARPWSARRAELSKLPEEEQAEVWETAIAEVLAPGYVRPTPISRRQSRRSWMIG